MPKRAVSVSVSVSSATALSVLLASAAVSADGPVLKPAVGPLPALAASPSMSPAPYVSAEMPPPKPASPALARLKKIDALNKDIEALAGKGLGENVDVNMFRDPAVLEVMADISARMSKVLITSLEFQPPNLESGWIRISGTTSNAEDVQEVMSSLAESTLFKVDPNVSQTAEGSQVTFDIRAYRVEKEDVDGSE